MKGVMLGVKSQFAILVLSNETAQELESSFCLFWGRSVGYFFIFNGEITLNPMYYYDMGNCFPLVSE